MLLFHLWSYFTSQSMTEKNLVEQMKKFLPAFLPLLYLPNWILVLVVVKMVQLEYNHSEDEYYSVATTKFPKNMA